MSEEKIDNRRVILDNALDLFYARGYEAVGVQELANSAGITKPTLYYYFKSKNGLLESVLEDNIPEFLKEIREAASGTGGLEETLLDVAKTYIRYVTSNERNHKMFYLFLGMEYSPRDSESHKAIEKYDAEIFNIFLNIFMDNKKLLGNMNGRQQQFAMGFMGILNYYLLVIRGSIENGDTKDVSDDEIYSLVHQFMHGIFS